MKRCSTMILRCVVAAGAIMLAIDGGVTWWAPEVWGANPDHTTVWVVLLLGLYSASIPFIIALFQAMKLHHIDHGCAFSDVSVKALSIITRCAVIVFIICAVAGLPFFYYWAQLDDAPGLVLMGMMVTGIAFVIAVFGSVLKRLFCEALAVKSENDLTI